MSKDLLNTHKGLMAKVIKTAYLEFYFSKKLNELNCIAKCYEKLHGGPVVVSLSAILNIYIDILLCID